MNDFAPRLTFSIKNSEQFFQKLLSEYADFKKDFLNPRLAINCAINSWHLGDWIFNEFFTSDLRFQKVPIVDNINIETISGLTLYQHFLEKKCPELQYMRLITNGTKHCILNDKSNTTQAKIHNGGFSDDFKGEDFDVTRLIIKDKTTEIDFEKLLKQTIEFWEAYLHSEYATKISSNSFIPKLSFEIRNSQDLLRNLLKEYTLFKTDCKNPRYALNCAINSCHLSDWTYHEFFSEDARFQDIQRPIIKSKTLFRSSISLFQEYIMIQCPELEVMRLVTNGTKHCILKGKTELSEAILKTGFYDHKFYSRDFYNVSKFIVKDERGEELDFEFMLGKTVSFWKDFLKDLAKRD